MTHPDLARAIAAERQASLQRAAATSRLASTRPARRRVGATLLQWLRLSQLGVTPGVCVDC